MMVRDINPGAGHAVGHIRAVVNDMLFFAATDGVNGWELWKTDDTGKGAVMVKDLNPGAADGSPDYLTEVNGTLFFAAYDSDYNWQLWKSDGTEAGTKMARDIRPGGNSNPENLVNADGVLFFTADDGRHGCELWRMTDYQLVNDECDRAITVYAGQTVEGANYQATAAISSDCGEMDTADVWYTFVPTVGGEYRIRVSSGEMDTTPAVYNKKCSGSELVCNDDYNPYLGTDSQVSLLMTKGAPYAIRVASFDGREGSFQLVVDAGTCTEPVVSDLNGDCVVNLLDFSIMASEWMTCNKMPVDLCD